MSLSTTPSIAELEGFKLTFKQRSHSPLCMPNYNHLSASRVIHDVEESSIVLNDRGKKRFEPKYSMPQEFRKTKRSISPPIRSNDVPRGKRYIPHPQSSDSDNSSSKKMLFASSSKRSESSDLPSISWKRRGKVFDESGVPAKDKESTIYNLEVTMNRKQRVTTSLDRRNGIEEATPGDKPMRKVEHAPGYYAEGGLIPGSTIKERTSTNPLAGKSKVQMTSSGKLEATYGAMQKRLQYEYDRSQVESLTVSFYCLDSFGSISLEFLFSRIPARNKDSMFPHGRNEQAAF